MNKLNTSRERELNAKILSCIVENMIEQLPHILEEFYSEQIVFNFPEIIVDGKQSLKKRLMGSSALFHVGFEVGNYRLNHFRQINSTASNDQHISKWSFCFTKGDAEDLQGVAWQTIRHWENGLVASETYSTSR